MADKDRKKVDNGKAFEYALATQYVEYLTKHNINTILVDDATCKHNRKCYQGIEEKERRRFDIAAHKTIETIMRLEPGLSTPNGDNDILCVSMQPDAAGMAGDVRDIVFKRMKPSWEIGFSAKNNHEAVKHSRLSSTIDFGSEWVGVPCSKTYWEEIYPIFRKLEQLRAEGKTWSAISQKAETYYLPVLNAFKKELLRIYDEHPCTPQLLVEYLIGNHPFYKIIKDDQHNLVVVKAFNLAGQLNKSRNGVKSEYKTPKLNYPTRIVEFELKKDSQTTLNMILDEGWEISFRIHSASNRVEPSLKFDIQLIGNPPILFTQHLFQ